MSIMDLMQQGGAPPDQGAPPPDPGAGGPPGADPMAALMGAAPGGAPPGPDPGAPPPGAGEEGGETGGDETTDVQEAITALQRAIGRPTTDNQEMAVYQTCIANLQKQLGKNESMVDSALGTNPQLRKALAGGGAG